MGILSAFRFAFQNVFFTPVLYGVIASLAVFSTTWEKADRIKDQLSDRHRSQQDTFDFIIVGGGSAGSVLANRLSKYHTVLLLEAGGESHPFQAIPALSLFIPNYPATDWSHKSPPQTTSCLSCVHKKYTFSQGKNLGGSGNLNYLIHLRGSPKDFDNWARITGDPRWTYTNVKTDFCTSEHFVGTTTDASAHGVGGPLQIEMPSEIGLANEWNWAGQEMGYRHLDLNGNYDEGFDALYYPIKHGVRQATYRAYIQPVRRRANLLIRKFAHVNKVLIREGTNDAYGVSYDRHGKAKYAFANKEIILSAGTLQTPKILMLSGIGPRTVLEPLHIPVKADLPVGKNLHDHISTLVGPFLVNSKKPFSYDDDVTPGSFLKFTTQGKGPLTTSGFQATALVASSYAKAKGQIGWPDIQLTLFGMSPHRLFASDFAHAFGLREDILQRFLLHSRGKSAFFILVSVARPESRGEFCITSKDPYKAPIIDPHYYSDPNGNDIKVMLEGIQRALFIAENTTIFQNCGTKFVSKSLPGCENHPFRSDGYWECYARHLSITLNDHVGTASMGYETSPFAVVDSELRVMRVNNLRVVDASVMPAIVGANTQASTIMIAEKIAAILIDKWKDFRTTDPNQAQYGPPPLPTQPGVVNEQYGVPGVTPGDPNSQYGPPGALPVTKDAAQSNSNVKVVPDDSLGSLRPPLVDSVDSYGNYDSFNLLKNKGFPSPEGLALGQSSPSSITPEFVQNPSTSPAPSPITTPGIFSPSISSTPVPSRGLKAPGQSDPNFYQQFPTPPIYNEVYDPVYSTSQTTLASPFPDSQTTAISSPTRGRGSKSYEFPPTLNSIQEESTSPENIEPTQQSLLTRGPNGQVIVRRRKRPPNVTVHPRGHLGYEDTSRNNREYPNSTTPNSIFPSTSIHPLPKEVVTIRQRRPVYPTRRRRLKTSAATTTPAVFSEAEHFEEVDQEVGADNGNSFTGYNQNQLTTPVTRLDVDTSTNRNVRFIPSANSTSVSKSVSAVINRLRNFIPPTGGGGGNSPSQTASRAKRGQNSIMDRLIRDRKSNLKNLHNNISKDTESDKNKTNENSNTQEDIEGAESEEMIIFSDVKVELGDTNSTKKEDEDHPFMPMDMDPVPKIIASSKKMLLIPPEQRILNISRFKKRKRAN